MSKSLQRTVQIGTDIYTITLLGAFEGAETSFKIMHLFGPLAGVYGDFVVNGGDEFGEVSIFTALATTLAHNINKPEAMEVVRTLLKDVYKGSHQIDVDEEFAGNLKGFVALLTAAFKENFSDFFPTLFKEMGLPIPTLEMIKEIMESTQNKSEEESNEQAQSQKTN